LIFNENLLGVYLNFLFVMHGFSLKEWCPSDYSFKYLSTGKRRAQEAYVNESEMIIFVSFISLFYVHQDFLVLNCVKCDFYCSI